MNLVKNIMMKVVMFSLIGTLFLLQINTVSAKELKGNGLYGKGANDFITCENSIKDVSKYELIDTYTEVIEDDEFIIKSVVNVYHANDENDCVMYSSNSYSTDFSTYNWTISRKSDGKSLVNVLLSATFKYNGTSAYVSECEYISTVYNGSEFVDVTESHTKKSSNAANAQYVVKGTVKNTNYNISSKYTLKLKCTCDGTLSVSPV